jgi:nicotinate phosphoribosyltransferase
LITLADERADGRALLECVMRDGARVGMSPGLDAVRDHAASELASLPDAMRDPFGKMHYSIEISTSLQALAEKVDSKFF